MSDKGFRILETGERIDTKQRVFNTCPVSGKSVSLISSDQDSQPQIDQSTPAVEIAGEIHFLCDSRHINLLEEGGTGGPMKPTNPIAPTQSTGVHTVLYIRVAFPDTGKEPQTEAAACDMMK